MKIISANAPYNDGGLGRYLATIVEEARTAAQLDCYFARTVRPNDALGRAVSLQRYRAFFHAPPLRWRHSWRDFLASDLFDRAVAHRLSAAHTFHGWSGQALHSFRRAIALGAGELILESATSHITNVRRQHEAATRAYPIEESWLNAAQYKKTLREYDVASIIYVSSQYALRSFLEAGVPATKLRRRVQPISPRFAPPPVAVRETGFRVVYVGRLQVSKGLPVLLQAFARLPNPDARLTLVGGPATEGMEHYLRRRLAADRRVSIAPGDPLPHLHRADVLVHPSFEDGLGLAPLEALACGVPVIVSAETGMKEYVTPGENGYVTPAGDVDALVARLETIQARPLRGAFAPLTIAEAQA